MKDWADSAQRPRNSSVKKGNIRTLLSDARGRFRRTRCWSPAIIHRNSILSHTCRRLNQEILGFFLEKNRFLGGPLKQSFLKQALVLRSLWNFCVNSCFWNQRPWRPIVKRQGRIGKGISPMIRQIAETTADGISTKRPKKTNGNLLKHLKNNQTKVVKTLLNRHNATVVESSEPAAKTTRRPWDDVFSWIS